MSVYWDILKALVPGSNVSVFVGTQTNNTTNNFGGVMLGAAVLSVAALSSPCLSACESAFQKARGLYNTLSTSSSGIGFKADKNCVLLYCKNLGGNFLIEVNAVSRKVDLWFCNDKIVTIDCDDNVVDSILATIRDRNYADYQSVTSPNHTFAVPERIDAVKFGHKWLCIIQVSGDVLVIVHALPSMYLINLMKKVSAAQAKKFDFFARITDSVKTARSPV
jgi:hypothetical protein